eukprot:594842_1
MNGQEMGFGEILNVRWAYDDPNPRAIARKKCQEQKYASDKIAERVASLRQCGPRLPTEYTSELLSAPTIAQCGPRLPTEYTSELLSAPTIAQRGPHLPTEYTSELLSAPTIAQRGPHLPTEYTSELLSAPTIAQRGPHLPTEYTSELLSAPTIAQRGPHLPTEYTSELLSAPTIAQRGPHLPTEYTSELLSAPTIAQPGLESAPVQGAQLYACDPYRGAVEDYYTSLYKHLPPDESCTQTLPHSTSSAKTPTSSFGNTPQNTPAVPPGIKISVESAKSTVDIRTWFGLPWPC